MVQDKPEKLECVAGPAVSVRMPFSSVRSVLEARVCLEFQYPGEGRYVYSLNSHISWMGRNRQHMQHVSMMTESACSALSE